jgi:hypothetical protein
VLSLLIVKAVLGIEAGPHTPPPRADHGKRRTGGGSQVPSTTLRFGL